MRTFSYTPERKAPKPASQYRPRSRTEISRLAVRFRIELLIRTDSDPSSCDGKQHTNKKNAALTDAALSCCSINPVES